MPWARPGEGEIFDTISSKYKRLEEEYDFTLIEGRGFLDEGTALSSFLLHYLLSPFFKNYSEEAALSQAPKPFYSKEGIKQNPPANSLRVYTIVEA